MRVFGKFCTASFCLLLTCTSSLADEPSSYSKQKRNKIDSKQIAITYSVEVIRNGKVTNADNSFAFRKGDDIRFHVQSNTDGYIYILASGADGAKYDVIYPPSEGSEKAVQKGKDYHLPQKGVKIKDSNSIKSMKLVFSKEQIDMDDTRSMSMPGLNLKPAWDTVKGLPLEDRPGSFDGENSKTMSVADLAKPLGIEVAVNVEGENSEKKNQRSAESKK